MRESKFQFQGKNIDPQNTMSIKAMLKKEPFFTAANSTLLNSYFFTREFLSEIIKADNEENFTLSGSSAFPAYVKPFRIPTDLDIQALKAKKAVELIQDTISSINSRNDGTHIDLYFKGKTSNNVLQCRTDVKLFDMSSCFKLDIQLTNHHSDRQKAILRKVISTDEEFVVPVQSVETMVAKKILSILNKVGEDRHYYRTKDFYDIYMLFKTANLDATKLDYYLQKEILEEIKSKPHFDRYNLANTRKTLPEITKNFDYLWGKMQNSFEVQKNVCPAEVKKFGLDLINEMSL
jgi:hypothetical protein